MRKESKHKYEAVPFGNTFHLVIKQPPSVMVYAFLTLPSSSWIMFRQQSSSLTKMLTAIWLPGIVSCCFMVSMNESFQK